jgi:hypothetical protein
LKKGKNFSSLAALGAENEAFCLRNSNTSSGVFALPITKTLKYFCF